MNYRQKRTIAMLCDNQNKMITSEYIAEKLSVTSRTIKSDMFLIADELKKNGAELISKRNKGYQIKIHNNEQFEVFMMNNSARTSGDSDKMNNDYRDYLSFARTLLCSEKGINFDEYQSETYFPRTMINEFYKWSKTFLESYHIEIKNTANNYKKASGEEFYIRLAIPELFAVHYHKIDIASEANDFSKWFGSNEKRNEIRHKILKVLRDSKYSFRDSNSQRLCVYIIVSYNRYIKGYHLNNLSKWNSLVKKTYAYTLAENVIKGLGKEYAVLLEDENEIIALASLLRCWLDIRVEKSVDQINNNIKEKIDRCFNSIEKYFLTLGVQLNNKEKIILENILINKAIQKNMNIDGMEKFNYNYESLYLNSPVSLVIAYKIKNILKEEIDFKTSITDLAMYATFVKSLLLKEYPVKPLKLCSVSNFGPGFNDELTERIKKDYPSLIEKIDCIELYEYRRYKKDDYDGFLVDMRESKDNEDYLLGYNYEIPAVNASNFYYDFDRLKIYNDLLISAYQFEDYLPDFKTVNVYEKYKYSDYESMIQNLVISHCKNKKKIQGMYEEIYENNKLKTSVLNKTEIILVNSNLCNFSGFDFYFLETPNIWKTRKIENIIFVSQNPQNVYQLKVLDEIVRSLAFDPIEMKHFIEDPVSTSEHIIRENLRLK